MPNAGQLAGFGLQITVVSFMISMVNVYPCPRHTREGDRNLDAIELHKVHAPPSGTTSSTPTSHTGDLQVECRIPPISASADFFNHELERHFCSLGLRVVHCLSQCSSRVSFNTFVKGHARKNKMR